MWETLGKGFEQLAPELLEGVASLSLRGSHSLMCHHFLVSFYIRSGTRTCRAPTLEGTVLHTHAAVSTSFRLPLDPLYRYLHLQKH